MLLLLVVMLDGSQINLSVDKAAYFDVSTRYGALKVPLADLGQVSFGVHYDDEKVFEQAVLELGKGEYKARDVADKFLAANPRPAYKWLKKAADSTDLEVKTRAKRLLERYKEPPPLIDMIGTKTGTYDGHIAQKDFVGESVSLGKLTVRLSQVKEILVRQVNEKVAVAFIDGWVKVGFVNGTCKVTAEGQIDMWPQQGGQWMASPDGQINGGGEFERYPAGALVGRLNGKEFLVGRHFSADNMGRGILEVRVNGVQWSKVMEGEYMVQVE